MKNKILVIDDEPETVVLLTKMLEISGFEAISSSDPRGGLELAEKERPDAVLLDIMMPDIDGYEVSRRLRASPTTAHIGIVMVTADAADDVEERGLEAGADVVLRKPVSMDDLLDALRMALSASAWKHGEEGVF